MKGPRHLWTGDWRAASHENDESLSETAPLRRPTDDPLAVDAAARGAGGADASEGDGGLAPGRRASRASRALVVVLILAVIGGAGVFANSLIGGDEPEQETAQQSEALPAVDSKPVKPKKGQTVAGAIYELASPAVLSVRAGRANGTAFLIDKDGTIVTNDHVVEGGGSNARLVVRFGTRGRAIDADLLGKDPSTDLAVLSIPKRAIPKGVKPLKFADSRSVRVGDLVVAIGNPFGLDQTATQGIVSALGRDIEAPNNYTINNVIQTDAPINPGNSGGPLLDDSAHVVGVNSQIATSGGQGNVGIGFAVPSNTVRQVVPILKRGGTVKRAYLGVQTSTPEAGDTGAEIASVVPGGPAASARLRVGDVVKSVAGRRVTDPSQLSSMISNMRPGQRVQVVVERADGTQTITVTLGLRPSTTSNP